jgi:hypothetical protein
MSAWMADKEKRLAKIREAKAALEAEAKTTAKTKVKAGQEAEEKRKREGRKKGGKKPKPPWGEREAKAQRNFTDPDSRILLAKDGYVQGYNAQVAVDETAQIIVAHELTSSMSDQGQFVPLIDGIEKSLGRKPKKARLTQVIAARPTFKLWPIVASAPMSPRAAPGAPAANSAEPEGHSQRPRGESSNSPDIAASIA